MSPVQILDADRLREKLCSDLGFSLDDRFENVRRLVYVAKLLAQNGVTVLVAAISPLHEMREMIRSEIPVLPSTFGTPVVTAPPGSYLQQSTVPVTRTYTHNPNP
jgi:adenylylsulfate kinase-like enzyme